MKKESKATRVSAFEELGFQETIGGVIAEIIELYRNDEVPWVIGYSGGKDSTVIVQLVWQALKELDLEERKKPVYVISTDTLVENPILARWVIESHEYMKKAADAEGIPIYPHRLTPNVSETFWVSLLGKGYPYPRPKFRWCTYRLKIRPSNDFITNVVRESGEAILVLGTRKAESAKRARSMEMHERRQVRKRLTRNASLMNCLVYTPIEDWTTDDVWQFLAQTRNPWGYDNEGLLRLYEGAAPKGEKPGEGDNATTVFGDVRFGCWICTLVEADKPLKAMIEKDKRNQWMEPYYELRKEIRQDDRHLRDFRRMTGDVQLFHDRPIPGPYKQSTREMWLRKLLEAQKQVQEKAPKDIRDIELITLEELQEIRRIWVVEKHEFEDNLPAIYEEVMGKEYPGQRIDDYSVFGAEELEVLRDICKDDHLHFELVRDLLDVERRYNTMVRRSGLYNELEKVLRKGFYSSEEDAIGRARKRRDGLDKDIIRQQLDLGLISLNSDSAEELEGLSEDTIPTISLFNTVEAIEDVS